MKWMENDLVINGEKFTILGLELFYPKEKVSGILLGLDGHVRTIIRYHLTFDFAFMAGVYPGITAICVLAKDKAGSVVMKNVLLILASIQLLAWTADILENYYLYKWITEPVSDNDFLVYRCIVPFKWIVALMGVIVSLPFVFRKRKISVMR
jgi:hypothetical protein